MKHKLQNWFALTEAGAKDVLAAARISFFVYFLMMLSPALVLLFVSDLLHGNARHPAIYGAYILVFAFVLYQTLRSEYIRTYDTTYAESASLRIRIAETLRSLPMAYLSKHDLSELSQLVMMDVNNVETMMSHALPKFLGFSAFFLLISLLLVIGNAAMGISTILPIWIAWICMFLSRPLQEKSIQRYYKTLLHNSEAFQQAFELHQEIKSYNCVSETEKTITQALYQSEHLHLRSELFMGLMSTIIKILPFLAPVCVIFFGTTQFHSGQLPLLYFIGYLIAASSLAAQYSAIQEFLLMIFFFKDSYKRLHALKNENVQTGCAATFDRYDINVKNVCFSYKDQPVLRDVSMTAPQGKITALVGPSGCGKTTLLRLISRLYDPDSGKISIGDQELSSVSLDSLYPNLSIVFQNVELFNHSILENIRMGRLDATNEEVLEAGRLANVDEIVARLPDGYETMIGENGSKLSGGERQRISIARAILKNAPIILLDEISSALDIENERLIQKSLQTLISNKTVIVISHRLRSIERADQIVVLNEGTVERTGTHEELLQNSPTYRTLWETSEKTAQFRYRSHPIPQQEKESDPRTEADS